MKQTRPRARRQAARTRTVSYPIGRCKPPVHSRWQKGQSGNPNGRRQGSKNRKTLEKEQRTLELNLLNELVTVDDNGHPRTMTKRQAVLMTVINKAMAGDLRAAQQLQQQRIYEARPEDSAPRPVLDAADEAVVKELYVRIAEMQKGITNEID